MNLKTPIILALDIDDLEQGLKIIQQLKFGLGAIKLGPRLIVRYGAAVVEKIAPLVPVFVDNKYYDIPSTMESAIRQTFEAGATFATIHASSGGEALARLAKVEKELNQKRAFKILAVTMLTSFSERTLPPNLKSQTLAEHVSDLAEAALNAGLSGIVCSPHEAELLRKKNQDIYLVTPGIRFAKTTQDDQARTMTASQALRAGASALVIGRPILEASKPELALRQILEDIGRPL